MRHEADREAELLRDLRRVPVAPTAYGEKFSSTAPACDDAFSDRPAPDTPDFASTTTPRRSSRRAARARAARRSRSSRDSRSAGRRAGRARAGRSSTRRAPRRTTSARRSSSASRCAPERSTTTVSAGGSNAAALVIVEAEEEHVGAARGGLGVGDEGRQARRRDAGRASRRPGRRASRSRARRARARGARAPGRASPGRRSRRSRGSQRSSSSRKLYRECEIMQVESSPSVRDEIAAPGSAEEARLRGSEMQPFVACPLSSCKKIAAPRPGNGGRDVVLDDRELAIGDGGAPERFAPAAKRRCVPQATCRKRVVGRRPRILVPPVAAAEPAVARAKTPGFGSRP